MNTLKQVLITSLKFLAGGFSQKIFLLNFNAFFTISGLMLLGVQTKIMSMLSKSNSL